MHAPCTEGGAEVYMMNYSSAIDSGLAAMVWLVRPWLYQILRKKNGVTWIPTYTRVFSPSVCRSSGCQSMTKPSQAIFEALSIQSCDERIGAFSDVRPARKMRAGLMCAKFSAACLRMIATFTKETRSSLLANPNHISASRVWENCSCETIVSGSFLASIHWSDFTSCSNYR